MKRKPGRISGTRPVPMNTVLTPGEKPIPAATAAFGNGFAGSWRGGR